MHMIRASLASVAALALTTGAVAQTSTETKVSTTTDTKDGTPVTKTKVEHVQKRKTHRPKKVLGVKVGHKTKVSKTVKETTTDATGNSSTTVKTEHK